MVKILFQSLNSFTARVFDRVLRGNSNFRVCGRNPMMWPFKWKLSACTFTWCYLFVKILENEILKFGRNLPLATFGSERVNTTCELSIFIRSGGDCQQHCQQQQSHSGLRSPGRSNSTFWDWLYRKGGKHQRISITVHKPLFSVHNLGLNKSIRRFYWSFAQNGTLYTVKSKKMYKVKEFDGLHNHSTLLTMV